MSLFDFFRKRKGGINNPEELARKAIETLNFMQEVMQGGVYNHKRIVIKSKDNIPIKIEDFDEFGDVISYKYFDRFGNCFEEKGYNYEELLPLEIVTTIKRKFNENNKVIKESEFDRDGILMNRKIFKYNYSGHCIEEVQYDYDENQNESKLRIVYTYDEGLIINEKYFDSNDNFEQEIIYNYSTNGKLLYKEFLDKDGNCKFKEIYKYDTNDNLTEVLSQNSEGLSKVIKKYDLKGNLIEELDIMSEKIIYEYDSNNNLIRKISNNGELKYTYKYDKNNNLIEERRYYDNDERITSVRLRP